MAGRKRRRNSSVEDIQQAVQAHGEESMSLRQDLDLGRPPILSKEEELQLLEKIQVLADWGFPLTGWDLCHFVKSYLDKRGMVSRFKNNLPKRRWVKLFLHCRPTFVFRKGNPIKRTRAAVPRENVQDLLWMSKMFKYFLKPENCPKLGARGRILDKRENIGTDRN
jgi:hypothetical protein